MKVLRYENQFLFLFLLILFLFGCATKSNSIYLEDTMLYHLDTNLESRSISAENPTGAKGEGGKAAGQYPGWNV